MALLTTSKEVTEILDSFRRATSIGRNLWARAAFGYSLSLQSDPEPTPYDSEGTELSEKSFFGNDGATLLALLRQRVGRVPDTEEIGRLVKAHVERGLRHFRDEFQRLGRRGDEFLPWLIEQSTAGTPTALALTVGLLPPSPPVDSYLVKLNLGQDLKTGDSAVHILNSPGTAPHVAIMGRNGTGKTRTALDMLSGISVTCSYPIPFLIFDYAKGDIASNEVFVGTTKACVTRLPGETIPLAPLSLLHRDEHTVQLAARRFRDTICAVVHLGPIMKQRCLRLITRLYQDFDETSPDLSDLSQLAEREYEEDDRKEDSLLACLREFSQFPLFRPARDTEEHDLFRQTHILDIHNLPEDLRKLASFLVLDRLYTEIMSLPDAPLDKDGNRQLRLIIVIDEAHHYMPCRQPTLKDMVTEVRSKGVSIWLLSQSPDDFDQPKYNFVREMGLAIIFSCVLEKPKMLEALLGGKVEPKSLSQLPAGVALTRLPESDSPTRIRAWQP
jgi:DNA sulfur modification protein DndE